MKNIRQDWVSYMYVHIVHALIYSTLCTELIWDISLSPPSILVVELHEVNAHAHKQTAILHT